MTTNPLTSESDCRNLLDRAFNAAIAAAMPREAVLRNLPDKPSGRCFVVGAGKASAAMAAAVDEAWQDVDLTGVVSTRYGHGVDAGRIRVIEAGHPVPDANSTEAAQAMLDLLQATTPDDLVLALISGGGSATLALPIEPLSLEEKQGITRSLLSSGASIAEMNIVRKHLSLVKGGKLAEAATPARLHTLIISDVPGDDPGTVASGPTVPQTGTAIDALGVIDRYHIQISSALRHHLETTASPPCTARGTHRVIASSAMALRAAADVASSAGATPMILGDSIEGESREVARVMASIARSVGNHATPALLISGGETTVTIGTEGAGRGGRNTEFALSLALALDGAPGVWGLAADSDGIDGTEDAAGAIVGPETLIRACESGISPEACLDGHDSYALFDATGDLIRTGPTLTNVNDIRLILVL